MRIRVSVYLKEKNREWLRRKSNDIGLSQSSIVNMLISQQQKQEDFIDKELENTRLKNLTGE